MKDTIIVETYEEALNIIKRVDNVSVLVYTKGNETSKGKEA